MPKISVIIPVYNVEKYLSRCLDSVINQTFSDIEIICINDGSTDNSSKILSEYADRDSRIKIVNQKNSGLSAARNTGLKNMSGQYISFIDSDDWIDTNYYECLLSLMNENDADIVSAGIRIVNQGYVSDNPTKNLITDNFEEKLKNLINGSVCDKLFKKDLFQNLEFPLGRYYEDNIVILQLMHLSHLVVFTNQVSYYYFINQSGICRSIDKKIMNKKREDRMFFVREIMKFARLFYPKNDTEIKNFLIRTIAGDFISKKSAYYLEIRNLFGTRYLAKIKLRKLFSKQFEHIKKKIINSCGTGKRLR